LSCDSSAFFDAVGAGLLSNMASGGAWSFLPLEPAGGGLGFAGALAVGGVFVAAFGWLLVKSPLVPAGDPRLSESLAFENV
jgi:hypothetical protein